MTEENTNDEWEYLRSKVEEAIENHDASFILKDEYKPYQIRYIQKCAELQKGQYSSLLAVPLFMISFGVVIGSNSKQSIIDYLFLIVGVGMIIGGCAFLYRYCLPKQTTCDEIILNAERRIQTLSKETEKE